MGEVGRSSDAAPTMDPSACRDRGHEAFVPDHGVKYERHARRPCAGYPVRQERHETPLGDAELTGMI